MLHVEQFRYASDNLAYLIYGEEEAIAVDGGAVEEIGQFLEENQLTLQHVINTHSHYDHTSGNDALLKRHKARFLSCYQLSSQGHLLLENNAIIVHPTPGHTEDSLCFQVRQILLTGDTLFNGTIGNCFSGRDDLFYQSVKDIMTLSEETTIYAGHDYVRDSILFAKKLEPENEHLNRFMSYYDADHVYSTLADELQINPYLRFNDEKMIAVMKRLGFSGTTEWERWMFLMSL
ncbi:MAG: MBL fold metallo-hydrolase [Syntrophobacterales bacterium]|jgi:hydroxyacylglutathione hydrolase|nr:MBL fold metallo-hydrolase [Syntrophobacterales bacterium]